MFLARRITSIATHTSNKNDAPATLINPAHNDQAKAVTAIFILPYESMPPNPRSQAISPIERSKNPNHSPDFDQVRRSKHLHFENRERNENEWHRDQTKYD
jgi:hypothetical protein